MNKPLVIITGASSGIGAGIAKLFSESGYTVGLLARNIQAMLDLKISNSICMETDITDFVSVKKAINEIEEKCGPVDGLINNAGVVKSGEFTRLAHEDHIQMIRVNLVGIINTIESILPKMQSRKKGTIINISSLADRNARPELATYAAAKAGLKSLSESLRMANAKHGIRVCNVAPAKIKTPLMLQSALTDAQVIDVKDMAKAILWVYEQPQNICIRDLVIAPTYYEA